MEKSKLFLTLSSLDLKERKRFSEYVHSPFFNKNEKVQQLCEIMLKAMDQPKKKPLLKTRVFKKIFKEDHYKEIKLNNVISDLLQLLQDLLGFVSFREDRILQQNLVARELISREQYQNFNTVTRRYDQLRAQSEVKNYHFYLGRSLYSLGKQKAYFENHRKGKRQTISVKENRFFQLSPSKNPSRFC